MPPTQTGDTRRSKMKLSEMTPDTNEVHRYFKEVAEGFEGREAWKKFAETHFSFEIEGDEEKTFKYFKYVKNKVQIFRDYGDLQQTERSNDPHTYAAPEGQVELEVRPERLDGIKIPRPRCNVYVPVMTPKKEEFEASYEHRVPTEYELTILTQVAMAGDKLLDAKPEVDEAATEQVREQVKDSTRIVYKPFTVTVCIKGIDGAPVGVKIWTPPTVPDIMRKCEFCSRRRSEMARCSGCKIAYYCCPEHQKLDWKSGHKQTCALKAKTIELTQEEQPFVNVAAVPWARPTPTLEQFHGGNNPVFQVGDYIGKPLFEEYPEYPAEGSVGSEPLASWEDLYGLLKVAGDSPAAVAMSDAMTLYWILQRYVEGWREKAEVTVHVVDACLEPTVLDSFSILGALLPVKVKIVMVGRRLPKEMHYKVYSWRGWGWGGEEGEPTGVMGDVWRGREEDRVAVRFYSDDYAAFVKKNDGKADCDAVVMLNAPHSRHSFFHSTTHICVNLIGKGIPTFFAAYSRHAADQIISSFTEVNNKESEKGVKLPMPTPLPPSLNPFRSPYKEVTEMPVPCYANMYGRGWV